MNKISTMHNILPSNIDNRCVMFIHLIYVSLKRGKFDIRGNPAYCMDHYTVTVGYHGCFFLLRGLSKNIIMAIFISINISWWLYSNILFLFPLNNIANIKI